MKLYFFLIVPNLGLFCDNPGMYNQKFMHSNIEINFSTGVEIWRWLQKSKTEKWD